MSVTFRYVFICRIFISFDLATFDQEKKKQLKARVYIYPKSVSLIDGEIHMQKHITVDFTQLYFMLYITKDRSMGPELIWPNTTICV